MTAYLVDTHVLLWWASTPEKLSVEARTILSNGHNQPFVSYASLWEIAIKMSQGKLTLPSTLEDLVMQSRIQTLNLAMSHIKVLSELPWHHRDPFDRLLVAQAKAQGLKIISRDNELRKYDVFVVAA